MKKHLFTLCLLLLSVCTLIAQTKPRFWDDVQTIKNYDKLFKPPVAPILFTGSSSIRKWDNIQEVFPGYNTLNRAIGGAILSDIIFYMDDLIFAYKPRQIVLYVGENDVPNESLTADSILNRTIKLFNGIRAKLPDVPIVYISMKASPSRAKYLQKVIDANQLIKTFLASQKNTAFVDVFHPMLSADGKARPELFQSDMLHLKPEGYEIWKKALKRVLMKSK